ncbi:kinesin-like protein KIN-12G [Typha latifolia]|uniref:kinesin-like protein KIN-12G n=1 Tax=Typha latifolia TaxID=4733 RepID=UPI003C30C077
MPAVADPVRNLVQFQDPEGEESDADNTSGNEGNRDTSIVSAAFPVHKFELHEDPSFWKDNNVQVVIRIRPLSSTEISLQGQNICVKQDSSQTITWIGHPESRFTFDHVADEHVSQEKLFKVAGVPMVENCVAGYNSCMFAYGQTGSGKTHTMLGDIEGGTRRHSVNCGMTPRVFEYLFSRIQKEKEIRRDEKLRFTCKCSFLEIYNEHILDLLDPNSANLQIREDARKGVYVENLTEYEVSSARDVMQQLIQGAANRKVAATNMNRASSRSHSVFTCVIESKWESQGITHHRFSRLNLVDLAGSERQKSSGAEGERLKEATNINKSLSTLGLVIMNLVGLSNKKSLHVPYRDSKLTFLLQDSLGGNSKTIIIANISPSNCCALETLSTLKFAQRAKFIRNNAIVNEDASGDVLSMRMQIQQLKKEVNRLRGLVNGGSEKPEGDGLCGTLLESPGSFKWDVGQGECSPLTFDKRLSQRKEYEAALVAAFRRDQEKEMTLKAISAGKQAAEQLAAQRTEEVRSLKMRLRFREEAVKRLEAVASGKLSVEAHLLQEKDELLKEIEALRNQIDRNPEITRFAMETLQLKEELRRLQAFVEEGEREIMQEQITVLQDKLLEALDWKLMHDKEQAVVQELSLSWESSGNEENEFLHLQAIQNQKEIEALRKNLNCCLEAKEKLERRVDELVSLLEDQQKSHSSNEDVLLLSGTADSDLHELPDAQMELKTMVDAIAAASQREAEAHETAIALAKENEELRVKFKVLIEDNNKLIELYEHAVSEGVTFQGENIFQIENTQEQDNSLSSCNDDKYSSHKNDVVNKDAEKLELQLQEMHEENEKLMGLYEKAMKERDEFKRMLSEHNTSLDMEEIRSPQMFVELDEKRYSEEQRERSEVDAMHEEVSEEVLYLVRTKLGQVEDKLASAEEGVKYFQLFEETIAQVDELSENAKRLHQNFHSKQQSITALKLVFSQAQERKRIVDNKFMAIKLELQNFCLKAHYLEEREAQARAGISACVGHLEQKKEELRHLQTCKDELSSALTKARQSESELRKKVDNLKLKLHDAEARKKETERVLFAIDNLDKADVSAPKVLNFGKASELLKSEEERTKVSAEIKQSREQLATLQKEIVNLTNKSEVLDTKIGSLETGIKDCILSLQEAEQECQQVVQEMKILLEMRNEWKTETETLLLDYQQCIFEVDLKQEEIRMSEEVAQQEMRSLGEIQTKHHLATQKLNELSQGKRFITLSNSDDCLPYVSEKVVRELGEIRMCVVEAKTLLPVGSDR